MMAKILRFVIAAAGIVSQERRASFWVQGRSNALHLRIVLCENQTRFRADVVANPFASKSLAHDKVPI
ncbi:hypothetical protein NKH80_20660 [Mesorhizobium sp. M0904]|uniref:hypothetical protein n=1 Tax=Mesorhizobium sp. M0904 TaxID=2957022 RepID=UPI00333D9FC5